MYSQQEPITDIMLSLVIAKFSYVSAVARGEAGRGAGMPPPQFFSQKVKTSVQNVENKILFPEGFETITFVLFSSFFNVHRVMHNNIKQPKTKNKPEIELTMITLKGETFAGFKIQRQLVFCFVIDVASVILSSMCIGLLRQCRK